VAAGTMTVNYWFWRMTVKCNPTKPSEYSVLSESDNASNICTVLMSVHVLGWIVSYRITTMKTQSFWFQRPSLVVRKSSQMYFVQ